MNLQQTPTLMRKHPKASAYILGVYDTSPEIFFVIAPLPKCYEMFAQLEIGIGKHHPTWNLDEIYYRGVDLHEAVGDVPPLESDQLTIREIVDRVKHHPRIVILAHAVGKKFLDD